MAKRIVALFLIIVFAVSAVAQTTIRQTTEQFENLKKEMEKVRASLEANSQKQQQLLTNLNDLDKSLAKLDAEKAQINSLLKKINEELSVLESELKLRQERLVESEKKLEALREEAGSSFRNMQKINSQGWWSFLFSSDSLSEFWVRSHQIKQIIQHDLDTIDELNAFYKEHQDRIKELEAQKVNVQKKKTELETTQKKLQTNEIQIKKNLDDKKRALSKIEQERTEYDRALREMEKASEELGEAIRLLQAKTLEEDGVSKAIKIIWPLSGRISSDYGWRFHPILKENRMHTGIDIAAASGVDIKAAADGTIILAGWVSGYGLTTVIAHGNNITTLYGHASKLLTQAGDKVKQGQVIAKVGSTGVSSGPHLHFEIRNNGDPVNPWAWLPADN
ncbi:MAG: peptidoglycan DD-metalloendopeptidase family protein [Firmicutes bacterium]|nr:peptidoglycan DD-metalloendopeptidase family protein [Bacillota bacterium]MDD4263653.1 peptidoglycan DD-metalloendopeptidase family protein [Bacillota bacterium]MDD4694214.1 peptidoglycan DD-metalloendopeptidase family protein [Bacillota bacterium]